MQQQYEAQQYEAQYDSVPGKVEEFVNSIVTRRQWLNVVKYSGRIKTILMPIPAQP